MDAAEYDPATGWTLTENWTWNLWSFGPANFTVSNGGSSVGDLVNVDLVFDFDFFPYIYDYSDNATWTALPPATGSFDVTLQGPGDFEISSNIGVSTYGKGQVVWTVPVQLAVGSEYSISTYADQPTLPHVLPDGLA
ncbi:MAG TPA: hypothetical protein DEP36_12270, partial [Gammaproteobacteria bacterium]|nr:hypothetical protein [Gammaproteobacteria bacterium]